MVETHDALTSEPLAERHLDPFSFHVGIASCIRGLGGDVQGDRAYAFHTPYIEVEPGVAHFTLHFQGLSARNGTLQLWVNMLPMEPGAHARVANSDRIRMNRIVHQGGTATIKFEGFSNVRYALHGTISDSTDAAADALTVSLDRPLNTAGVKNAAADARSSAFGRDKVDSSARLISLDPPSLVRPVAQMATANQLGQPTVAALVAELGLAAADPLDQWRHSYLIQVLRCYGMLETGAQALAVNLSDDRLVEKLAQYGLEVSRISLASLERQPEQTSPEEVDTNGRSMDYRLFPADLLNFDVLLCEGDRGVFPSVREHEGFIEASNACLRPGGFAIHLVPYDPTQILPIPVEDRTIFTRHDVERLALMLISRRYEVAQIKIDHRAPLYAEHKDSVEATSFGLIVRRPPSVL